MFTCVYKHDFISHIGVKISISKLKLSMIELFGLENGVLPCLHCLMGKVIIIDSYNLLRFKLFLLSIFFQPILSITDTHNFISHDFWNKLTKNGYMIELKSVREKKKHAFSQNEAQSIKSKALLSNHGRLDMRLKQT